MLIRGSERRKMTRTINLARVGMALIEGRDYYRQGRKIIVRYQGEERSLSEWARHLEISREVLIGRFNRAVNGVNERARRYTVNDLLTRGYLREPILCPMLGLYLMFWIIQDAGSTPRLFLVASELLRSCDRKQYAQNVCRIPCYKILYEEPTFEDPEHARKRQKAYSTTEKGRRTRRDSARRRLLVGAIETQMEKNGAINAESLLERCELSFDLRGDDAVRMLESALRLYYKKNPPEPTEEDKTVEKWLAGLNLLEAAQKIADQDRPRSK